MPSTAHHTHKLTLTNPYTIVKHTKYLHNSTQTEIKYLNKRNLAQNKAITHKRVITTPHDKIKIKYHKIKQTPKHTLNIHTNTHKIN